MKKEYPGIKVETFPKPVLKAMKKATDSIMQSYADKNQLFKEIWNDQKAFMSKARKWSYMSRYYYLQASKEVE